MMPVPAVEVVDSSVGPYPDAAQDIGAQEVGLVRTHPPGMIEVLWRHQPVAGPIVGDGETRYADGLGVGDPQSAVGCFLYPGHRIRTQAVRGSEAAPLSALEPGEAA